MRKTIAVDLDDVLASSAQGFVDFSNKRWGTNLQVEDYSEHWAQMWQIDEEEVNKRKPHVHSTLKNFGVIDGASHVLRKLANDYDLIIVTSRERLVQQDTIEWVERHYEGIFRQINFAGIWDGGRDAREAINLTKGDLLRDLEVSYLIDDQPKHCIGASTHGITSLLFGDYVWNRNIETSESIIAVKTWEDVHEYFYGAG